MSKKIVWNTRYDDAEINDFYATDPIAMKELLKYETFSHEIWEPACGEGHLSKVLIEHGYDVYSSDLVYRGFGDPESFNFLEESLDNFNGDIVTNPPYKYAKEFVKTAIETIKQDHKIAIFLKLTFLEGQARKKFFKEYPPKIVYVFSNRITCGKNGTFYKEDGTKIGSAVAYCWFVWEKGFKGDPIVRWI